MALAFKMHILHGFKWRITRAGLPTQLQSLYPPLPQCFQMWLRMIWVSQSSILSMKMVPGLSNHQAHKPKARFCRASLKFQAMLQMLCFQGKYLRPLAFLF